MFDSRANVYWEDTTNITFTWSNEIWSMIQFRVELKLVAHIFWNGHVTYCTADTLGRVIRFRGQSSYIFLKEMIIMRLVITCSRSKARTASWWGRTLIPTVPLRLRPLQGEDRRPTVKSSDWESDNFTRLLYQVRESNKLCNILHYFLGSAFKFASD